jgi:glycosyltransferase involved in cell wall biosynthesis
MRIAVLAPPHIAVPPVGYGGTEAVLDGLCRGLRAAGHDVLLVTTGDATCPVERTSCFEEAMGVGVRGTIHELTHVVHGYEAADRWGADVVHDHTLAGPLYAASAGRHDVVTTNHGPFTDAALGALYRSLAGRVPVVAISHHQASTAVPGTDVAAVIHHGLPREQHRLGTGRGGFALFLGRMHPSKGVDRAVRIASRAGVPLVVAAKMQEREEVAYFERHVEPLLGRGARFVGEVGGEQKQQLLGEASVLLNPIRWHEPFGMVMIEALAAGTPVVAPATGSVPEIVRDGVTGFLRNDEAGMADALGQVASLDRRACHDVVRARFSVERMVHDHLQLYGRVHAARPDAEGAHAERGSELVPG